MPNAGPLTTTFTAPPAACETATGLYQVWDAADAYYYEQGPLASLTTCYPDGYDPVPEQYYSPGLCPSGYTAACSSTDVVSATATETAYTCCPTGHKYTCAASSTTGERYLGCVTSLGAHLAVAAATAISGGKTYSTSTVESTGFTLGANSIAVRSQSGDFPAAAAATTSSASATASSSIETAPVTSSKAQSTALSTVGIAAIAAGSAGGALIIASSIALFLWLRRRKKRSLQSQKPLFLPSGPPRPPGPPPVRPPRPPSLPPLPPPKDRYAWPTSPTPSSTVDFKKARYDLRHDLRRSRSHDDFKLAYGRDTKSTYDSSLNGPFELPAAAARSERDLELHELHGRPGTPDSATRLVSPATTTTNFWGSAPRLVSPMPSTDSLARSFWTTTPPAFGAQPAERGSPARSAGSPRRHRRMPTGTLGSSLTPAELPGGFM